MNGMMKMLRPLAVLMFIGAGWVCFAQVQDAGKAPPPPVAKKPVPAVKPVDAAAKPGDVAPLPPLKAVDVKKGDVAASKPSEADVPDDTPIRESAEAFTKAYNAHDAKAVSLLFAQKAEITDEAGNVVKGRDAIENYFGQTFTEYPECKVEIDIASIRHLTPNIAIEEGLVRGWQTPDADPEVMAYVAIHIRVEGQWLVASVSDFAIPVELTPQDHLQELAWLVGEWIEEGSNSSIKTNCRWDDNGNYLIQDFALHVREGSFVSGSMRIGWDALRGQIKSWTFNADGSHSEGYWTRVGDAWVVKSQGVNAKGQPTSVTSVYRYVDSDTVTWHAYDRIIGGENQDPLPEFIVKRHAPQPAQ